jgi:hypothetical protein
MIATCFVFVFLAGITVHPSFADEQTDARIRELEDEKAKLTARLDEIVAELDRLRGRYTIPVVNKRFPCDIAALEPILEVKSVSYDKDAGSVVWLCKAKTKLGYSTITGPYNAHFYDANGVPVATKPLVLRPASGVNAGDVCYIVMLHVEEDNVGEMLAKTTKIKVIRKK